MTRPADPSTLSVAEKDALILELLAGVAEKDALIAKLLARVAELEAKLGGPPKTPDNSSTPPSSGQKPNRPVKGGPKGRRKGSLGRKGGGRPLASDPDQLVIAKAAACAHCCLLYTSPSPRDS